MNRFDIVVIGGGAAGIVAAISARRKGKSVLICERMPRLGKKILISGSGRCNLLNEDLSASHYNSEAGDGRDRPLQLVKSVFSRFGRNDIERFFNDLGLKLYSQDTRIFPVTGQASSVLKVLEEEIKRLEIGVEFNFKVTDILDSGKGFVVRAKDNRDIHCSSVIIAGGGRSYPSLGSDGSCYNLASRFGHNIIEPVPSAVPLVVKDKFCHALQGQRISCVAKSIIDGIAGKAAEGEVLFAKYGLSGTAILDISEDISIAINRLGERSVTVSIDMVPFMDRAELEDEIKNRISRGFQDEDLLIGVLPNKFSLVLKDLLKTHSPTKIAGSIKDKRFQVIGTRGWNEAEFSAGGIDIKDVKESTLESRFKKGIYFAGEVLDVNGERGGYNLAWAWASGFVAGLTE